MLPDGIELQSLESIGCHEPIPETETTLEGNARLKAHYVMNRFGCDAFADDTGLEVAALDGAPGVYSARYAGENGDADANIRKLLREMEGKSDRRARFRTAIALVLGGATYIFEGKVDGHLLEAPRGMEGFGYDPIFVPAGDSRSFAEYSLEEKNRVSHRGRAFAKLIDFLSSRLRG